LRQQKWIALLIGVLINNEYKRIELLKYRTVYTPAAADAELMQRIGLL